MAQTVCVVLSTVELAAIAADRNRPRKHVERERIVLASADRHPAGGAARRGQPADGMAVAATARKPGKASEAAAPPSTERRTGERDD